MILEGLEMMNETKYQRYTYHDWTTKMFVFSRVHRRVQYYTKMAVDCKCRPRNVLLDTLEGCVINAEY